MEFEIGTTYTRDDIHDALGGEKVTYLPQRDKQIVCGCFVPSPSADPDAPEEVLVGTGPRIEEKARVLCAQGGTIPVVLMRSPKHWEYAGRYRVEDCSTDPALLHTREEVTGRSDLTMVIRLQRAE